ncbi:MAG: protein-L-isoaspartate(D-aspartate) O-methyltransferase [Rhodospirillales bacterium]|nr:protein-L-isoaspartate(D-aspartate) O-methyltransferase [Rhodospirillales bacterium]
MTTEETGEAAGLAEARQRLLQQIAQDFAETASWTGRPVPSERTMRALSRVSREAFISERDWVAAYDNRPLSIGYGQTISQPFIVALMTDLLDLEPEHRVLEIGTGCGYQAAVLAELAAAVFSIELVGDLALSAQRRLRHLGYENVRVRQGDGFQGWTEEAPFDAIIVTAAPEELPEELPAQLVTGGRLVIPIGPRGDSQMLWRCVKQTDGTLDMQRKLPVAFVPMLAEKKR